jgi:hypothetical protein
MTQRYLRIATAALTLAAVLVLAAPAHAAGRAVRTPGIYWIEDVVQWVARVWMGIEQDRTLKYGIGIDPNGNPAPPPPSGFGSGIDPNGELPDTGAGIDTKG